MLGNDDLGHRVVVRARAGERAGRPLFRDHLGTLTDLSDTSLTVATAAGPVTVPLAAVHRAKRVPPRPDRPPRSPAPG
ncbi:hypothetical protein GCM10010123_33160 [Pilimelia anulata]|uniref:Uncharacterized protein n=1 Tax=Pilimelia anulata TaxID=53371 RepID=A0A8J3B749_9ACTN|nr:hypothetical protein GCM10010123_33160 [Pilimelia anulata]